MASEWVNTQLEAIAADNDRAFAMGPFGSNIRAENYRESGVPVIRGTNLGERGDLPFKPCDFVFLSEEKADELASSNAYPNDIVFVAQGTVGKVGIIPTDMPYKRFVLSQNLMKVTVNPKQADPRFVFYFFRSHLGQHEIMSRVNPTGVPCISKPLTSLRQFGVRLPCEVKEQRAIAHILGTLDDKIELNRKMNRTLEAMAQALFKNWFVDFEPFRDQGMGDSPIGPIPKGWNIVTIDDLGNIVCGKTPSTREPDHYGGNVPFITIPDMHNKVFITVTTNHLSEKGALTQSGKLLPKHAVCVSCIATPGLVTLTSEPSHTNQQINSIICDSTASALWCYLAMTNIRQEIITGGAGGSATLNLNKAEFSKLQLVKPHEETMWKFHSLVEPLFSRILSNDLEDIDLATIREALLPKLLSGAIRVKDAERFAERAV